MMIQTRDLSLRFGSTQALEGLDLEIATGEVFGFLGPNGAGKTTTIRLLLGLLAPDRGHCRVFGMDVASEAQEVRRRCGALLEATGLYEHLSVLENLRFFGAIQGVASDQLERRIDEQLDRFGLSHKRKDAAGLLSCGMKQKLGIARAMLHGPRLLFLDEPTLGLDPAATVELRELLMSLAREDGVTLFITSHNLSEIERICDRVGFIQQGRLKRVDALDAFRRDTQDERLTLRATRIPESFALPPLDGIRQLERSNDHLVLAVPEGHDVSLLIREAIDAGLAVQEVRRDSVTLEQAYMRLVETSS